MSDEWMKAVFVWLSENKGSKNYCKIYRGISLLSKVGKVYGRTVNDSVKRINEPSAGKAEGGFKKGCRCIVHISALRLVEENVLEKKENVSSMCGFIKAT